MSATNYYLKQNIQIEPLYNQWYAWPHLIPPATAAMNVANLHVKIMRSYLKSPEVHAAAVKDPALRGGPFLDVDRNRASEIKELLDRTLREQSYLLEFADAIKQLNDLLSNEARGHSLEPLYEKVPELLKGYIELVYDLNNNPSFRLIEALLYQSKYYDRSLQSFALSQVGSDERPFVFSTPRLKEQEGLQLNMPFSHPGIDELFQMRSISQPISRIKDCLNIEPHQERSFDALFTGEPPRRFPKYEGDSLRIRYLGHACILIESKDICILTDPVISYSYNSEVPRFTFADLPDHIDYILLTHAHSDHVILETLLQLRHKTGHVIVPRSGGGALEDPSLKLILQNIGFPNVIEIDEMETLNVKGGSIVGLPFLGEHGDLNVRTKIAHLIRLAGVSVLCAADTRNLENKLYEHIHEQTGDVDIMFVGMECEGAPLSWLYGPLQTKQLDRRMDQSRRLSGSDCRRALDVIDRFHFKRVYVYAMGAEPWLSFITTIQYTDESKPIVESNQLIDACRSRGIYSERLYGIKEIFASST
jgi:L-ascorbate metabolism protein UlaG (beta-lactamase superfamily)